MLNHTVHCLLIYLYLFTIFLSFFSLYLVTLFFTYTSISDCLKGQLAVIVCHHYQCFHMNAQSHMCCSALHSQCLSNTLYHQVLVPHNSYTPGGDVCGCWCLCLCENDAVDRERDRGREGNRGRGRRGFAGPSFMLNKAMMGDRLGTTSQAETGLLSFVHRGSLRREEEGKMESQQSAFRESKVWRGERICLCGVRCVGMCSCVELKRHKHMGWGKPQPVLLLLLSRETNSLKPTQHCRKKTENNNKSKQRTSLLSSNPLSLWWLLMRE